MNLTDDIIINLAGDDIIVYLANNDIIMRRQKDG